jgi:hypothetical protein
MKTSLPEGVHTYAGRLASFSITYRLPSKSRASATHFKSQNALAWPHKTPSPEQVTSIYTYLEMGGQFLIFCSLRKLVSTIALLQSIQIALSVSFAVRASMGGRNAMTQSKSILNILQTVDGQSTRTSSRTVKHGNVAIHFTRV